MNQKIFSTQKVRQTSIGGLFVIVLLTSLSVFGQLTPPEVPPLTPDNSSVSTTTIPTLPEPTVPGASLPEPAVPVATTMPEPVIPTSTMPESTQSLPVLPDTSNASTTSVSDMSNCRPSPVATSNPNFQANYNKVFVGHPSASWPPTYGTSTLPAVANMSTPQTTSDLPTLPVEPQTAPVNNPISQVPDIPMDSQLNPMDNSNSLNSQVPVIPDNANVPVVPVEPQVSPQPSNDAVAVRTIHIPRNQNVATEQQVPQIPISQEPVPQVPQNTSNSLPPIEPQVEQPVEQQPLVEQPVQQQIPPQVQQPVQQSVQPPVQKQVPQQAQRPAKSQYMFTGGSICALNIRIRQPGEHPMAPLVPWAKSGLEEFSSKIQDYTCVMTKRERINGKLSDTNSLFMKVREKPYSVYVYYLTPDSKKGVEALYRKGYHNDQLLGHDVGMKGMFGAVWLDPKGRMAMMGQKYPITDAGIPNLVKKMLETVTMDLKNDPDGKNTTVKFVENGGNIDGRPCIRVDVSHPKFDSCYRFHLAEIYLDKEWGIPVRYAAWMWPEQQGGKPVLDEEFTMTKIKFNVGLTDKDFSETNPDYKFKKK